MRLKLRTRLIILVLLASAGICTITLLANNNLQKISRELIKALYEDSDINISLVLNADRDLYQALLAHHYMIHEPADSPIYAEMQNSFTENIEQAETRLKTAENNIKNNPELYKKVIDLHSGLTIEQSFGHYWEYYNKWYNHTLQMQAQGQDSSFSGQWAANQDEFNQARYYSNIIGEILDLYAQEQAGQNWNEQKRIQNIIYVSGFITIFLLIFLSFLIIRDILNSVSKAGSIIQDAASGAFDLHAADNLIMRRDELGLIAQAFQLVLIQHSEEIHSSHLEMIYRLSQLGELHNQETAQHVKRVGSYSSLLGELAGIPNEQVKILSTVASIHDIGKAGIPSAIVCKQGPLTDEEWKIMQQHTVIGGKIFEGGTSNLLQSAMDVTMYHHERWDGTGYPTGISGLQIPLLARICAISDAFDAMTSDRPYREALTTEQALEEIKKNSGIQFDPYLVEVFLNNIEKFLAIRVE